MDSPSGVALPPTAAPPLVSMPYAPAPPAAAPGAGGAPPAAGGGRPPADVGSNLFVASLPPGTDDARLRAIFEPFGSIVSAKVMVDLKTKTLRNHGFVRFVKPEEAQAAINGMHKRRVDDSNPPIHVVLSTHRDDANAQECEIVYVRNLPDSVNTDQLRKVFEPFGSVIDVLIPSSQSGHQGVGFVRYATVAEARDAVKTAHNTTPFGANRAIQVRFKETRQMSQRRGAAGRNSNPASGKTTPWGSPNTDSFGMPIGTPNFPMLGTPQQMVVVPLAPQPHQGSPPGQNLQPLTAVPLQATLSPTAGSVSPHNAGLQGTISPTGVALTPNQHSHMMQGQPAPVALSLGGSTGGGSGSPNAPFSLAASGPMQTSSLVPPPGSAASMPARPFPGPNDLFFANYTSQEWLLDTLRQWQPTLVQPSNGTCIVRLSDENLHVVAAQNLGGMVGPTGLALTVALVRT